MSERVEAVVIGAGVIGLAIARALSLSGKEVIIIEGDKAIAMGTSSRNSEVIHAGIYYPKDSLKAELCVEGKHRLYTYCKDHGVPFKRLGKLIVATDDNQLPALDEIDQKARANGVDDLIKLTRRAVGEYEPTLEVAGALFSPSTGIIDSHALMLALQGDAENNGTMIALNSPVISAKVGGNITLQVGGDEPMTLETDILINAAGLHAPEIANRFDGLDKTQIPNAYFCKGNYFSYAGKTPFSHLVYPVPNQAGLGVHLTLDMAGQARFGPDVEWLDANKDLDYSVDPDRGISFYDAIREYWPDLEDGALVPDYAGIRPKIVGPGEPAADFLIQGPSTHKVDGLVNLFGIESPGLTSCLALADRVLEHLNIPTNRS